MASYDAKDNHGPKISYADVDISLVKPVLRDYSGKKPAEAPKAAAQATEKTA